MPPTHGGSLSSNPWPEITGAGQKDLDAKNRYILENEAPNEFLQTYVQARKASSAKPQERKEDEALHFAHDYLAERIRKHAAGNTGTKKGMEKTTLIALRDRVLGLQFISIELLTEDDASTIFETLNTRGKDLATSDLVKNLFTRLIPVKTKGVDKVRDQWNGLTAKLYGLGVDVNIDTFIQHHWRSTRDYVAKARLFKEIKKTINKDNATQALALLRQDGDLYSDIVAPEHRSWKKEQRQLRESLMALRVFGVAQAYPLVLSILRLHKAGTIDLKSAKSSLALIESFTFQFNAITSSPRGGGTANMYAKLAQAAHKCDAPQQFAKVHKEMKEKFTARKVSFEEFEAGYSNLRFLRTIPRDRALVRYILKRTSQHYGLPVEIDADAFTVEHIWSESDAHNLDDPQKAGMIGNLVYVSEDINQQLKTKAPLKKLDLMKTLSVKADAELLSVKSWGDKDILARTSRLAKLAYGTIWKL